ncbi:MAG: hydrolase [Candidatus Micrarchaeia archaeon]
MKKEAVCCPPFDPKKWDNKTLDWRNRRFVKARVFTLFYMPVNFGSVMTRLVSKIEAAGARMPDALCLADHASMWGMDLFVGVDRKIPGVENVTLSGKYLCKVYEGPFSDTGKWCKDFEAYAKRRKARAGKPLMWYTTCPKCAKKYGKNYVAILARLN